MHVVFKSSAFALAAADLILTGKCRSVERIAEKAACGSLEEADRIGAWMDFARKSPKPAYASMGFMLLGLQQGAIRKLAAADGEDRIAGLCLSTGWGPVQMSCFFSERGAEQPWTWSWSCAEGEVFGDPSSIPNWLISASSTASFIFALISSGVVAEEAAKAVASSAEDAGVPHIRDFMRELGGASVLADRWSARSGTPGSWIVVNNGVDQ